MTGGERRFAYGASPWMLAIVGLFFGACGAFFVVVGSRGTPLRLWPLPVYTSGAPVYVLAAASFAFVVVAVAQAIRGRMLGPRQLVIADAYIEAPRNPWTRDVVRIARGEVVSVQATSVSGTRAIAIATRATKVSLSNRTVGDEGYDAVLAWLRGA